jgi:hypothetical protein
VAGAPLWPLRDDRTLSAYAKLAYYTLWTRLPEIHPSMRTLASDMAVAVSTAHKAVRELESAGLVKVLPRVTELGDPDSNQFVLTPLRVTDDPSTPNGRPPLRDTDPKNASSRTEVKGENSRASRHARPALSRGEMLHSVRRAVMLSYSADEAEELTDGQAVALWLLLINNRRPADPVKYLCKIFEETPYLDTHLANAGTEEDWT